MGRERKVKNKWRGEREGGRTRGDGMGRGRRGSEGEREE